MKLSKLLVISVAVGVLVTLATGLVENMPLRLVGAMRYGYPLAWRITIIYLGLPTTIDPVALIGDIIFWAVIVFIILLAVTRGRAKKA